MTLEELQAKYQELHPEGKEAPARYKNDAEWMTKKVEELMSDGIEDKEVVEKAPKEEKEEKVEKPAKKADSKFEEYKQRLYDLDNGIPTTCDETGVKIASPYKAKVFPKEYKIVFDFEGMGLERPE